MNIIHKLTGQKKLKWIVFLKRSKYYIIKDEDPTTPSDHQRDLNALSEIIE